MRFTLPATPHKEYIEIIAEDRSNHITTGCMPRYQATQVAIRMIAAAQEIFYRTDQHEAANECDNVLGSIE